MYNIIFNLYTTRPKSRNITKKLTKKCYFVFEIYIGFLERHTNVDAVQSFIEILYVSFRAHFTNKRLNDLKPL